MKTSESYMDSQRSNGSTATKQETRLEDIYTI